MKSTTSVRDFAARARVSRTQAYEWFRQDRLKVRQDLFWDVLEALGLAVTARMIGYGPDDATGTGLEQAYYAAHVVDRLVKHLKGTATVTPPPRARPRGRANSLDAPVPDVEVVRLRRVPYFDVNIPAGGWTDTCCGRHAESPDGYVEVPEDAPGDSFAIRIRGDSMTPDFPDASVIILVPVRPGEALRAGRAYCVEHSDDKCTFKFVFHEPQHKRFRLESCNKAYKPLYVPEHQISRLSRAIKLVRDLT